MLACTVATVSHLAGARALARSFLENHPDGRFAALVVDDPDGDVAADHPFEVLRPDDLQIGAAELARMELMYGPSALACALKPHLLRRLLREEVVAYLDSDCLVYASLGPLFDAAKAHGVALTAHSLTPAPLDRRTPVETLFQRHGPFNAGVLAVGPGGGRFLDWWSARVARHAVMSDRDGLTLDQSWLALVPALFDHVVVRDPGINVMGWNVHDRDVAWDGETPYVPGGPLRCFHFAGSFDPHEPAGFSPSTDPGERWLALAERPGVARVCDEYASRLLAAGYDRWHAHPYAFATLPDGTPIDDLMRAAYREALLDAEIEGSEEPPNPFAGAPSADFQAWLIEPSTRGVSPYLSQVRKRRPDLIDAFPEVPGADGERLAQWGREAADRGEIDLSWAP